MQAQAEHVCHIYCSTRILVEQLNTGTTDTAMSGLTYSNYHGFGQTLSDTTHYSQAVVVPTTPPLLKISGQGPWDPNAADGAITAPKTPDELRKQIDQAFSNVELTLKNAGSTGWNEVYLVRIYYVVPGDGQEWKQGMKQSVKFMGDALRKWCPEHRPLCTAVEVRGLAAEGMVVDVEVEALLKQK